MATYNGEQHIDKQILSIIAQTYQNWELIIHDDGSTDNTVEIVKHFCRLDKRIRFIDDGFTAQNAAIHFMYMLQFADAPYICFCDQDDIWLEKKLEIMLNIIATKNNEIPQAVYSDAYLFHDKSNIIDGKLLFVRPTKLEDILFTNGGIHGSASIFNAKMKECLNMKHHFVAMHDHLMTLICCTFGQATYINDKLFLYRQHQNNVTGNINTSIMARLTKAFGKSSNKFTLSRTTTQGVESFLLSYRNMLNTNDIALIDNYLKLPMYGPVKRLWLIMFYGYTLNHSQLHLWVKILTRKFIDIKI